MANKSKRRQKLLISRAQNRAAKDRRMRKDGGGGQSNYARKFAWLNSNGLWGFEVPDPKPWRKQR